MKIKRIWSLLIVIVMIFSTFLMTSNIVLAADGQGTEASPYLIKTAQDLFDIPADSNSHYRLMNNIDLKSLKKEPLGNFKGVLDGNNFTIKNLNIVGGVSKTNIGLFQTLNEATIKNVNIESASILAVANYAGVFAGVANKTSFINCTVKDSSVTGLSYTGILYGQGATNIVEKCITIGSKVEGTTYVGMIGDTSYLTLEESGISTSEVKGTDYVGALVGSSSYATKPITKCFQTDTKITGSSRVGGLFGFLANSTIENCYSKAGSVNAAGSINGGFAGHISVVNIKQCYSTTDISSTSTISGGLVGYVAGTNTIKESYAVNAVKASSYAGGIVGYLYSGTTTVENTYHNGAITATDTNGIAAGIAPFNITIKNCYAANTFSAKTIYGLVNGTLVTNSYFDETISKTSTPTNQARTTEAMKMQLNYSWDFDTLWTIMEDSDYPRLQFEYDSVDPPVPPIQKRLKVILEKAEELQLSLDDELTENKNFKWTSSDASIVTVDSDGMLKAIKNGTVVITVESSDGTYKEEINVFVVPDAKEYRLAVHLKVGAGCRLSIDDGKDTTPASWLSNATSIATVTNQGRVTAVAKGLALVVAKDENKVEIGQVYVRVK